MVCVNPRPTPPYELLNAMLWRTWGSWASPGRARRVIPFPMKIALSRGQRGAGVSAYAPGYLPPSAPASALG